MEGEFIDVQLTREERALIMRYGCPFDGLKASLETCDDHEFVVIPVERFELGRLIADLCIAITDLEPCALQEQLIDLCDRMEIGERTGNALFDPF